MRSSRHAQILTMVLAFGLASQGMHVDAIEHTVAPSDTLFGLSIQYEVPMAWIRRANNLDGDAIRAGERLEIPTEGFSDLAVRPGDTLSGISAELDVAVDRLRSVNHLDSDFLTVGQKLIVPPPTPSGYHRVSAGDSLLSIANRYGLSLDRLKMINGLNDDVIHPDQLLSIRPTRPDGHRVGPGESLWSIADKYHLTMGELKDWNDLERDVIHPGEMLVLYPGLEKSSIHLQSADIALASLPKVDPEPAPVRTTPELPTYGEYFYSAPKAQQQPDENYWESADASSLTDYRRATKILELFDSTIAAEGALGDSLSGYHIVLDPGHGGLDPGAIVSVADGNGNPVVVTEDEYAYDITMRLYRILKRHGASVSLTILAPDHHIRDGRGARQTFVHRKNEVYNDEAHNGNAGWRPVGTPEGLDIRKDIASETISSAPAIARRKGTLFISIHADNSSDLPAGTAVLFDGEDEKELASSKRMAELMAPRLGAGSFIRRQQLRVLRNNPADAAVLVEARNIHYTRNAWALRSTELREQDARMIADGVMAWVDAR